MDRAETGVPPCDVRLDNLDLLDRVLVASYEHSVVHLVQSQALKQIRILEDYSKNARKPRNVEALQLAL